MVGSNGDFYLNSITGDVYQKQNNIWVKVGNIKGPAYVPPNASKVRVYNGTLTQALSAGQPASKIYFPSKEFDVLNEFNTTLYRFTALEAGYYLVTANVGSTVTNIATMNIYIYKNGVSHSTTYQNTTYPHVLISDIIYLSIGDYIELWGKSGVTVSNSLQLGQTNLWMSISRLL